LGLNLRQTWGFAAADVFVKNAALLALFTRPHEVMLDVKLPKKRIATGTGLTLPDGRRLVILRDITEQHDLDARRESLVATLAHDLRNPLTGISAYLDLVVQSGAITDEQREFLTRAHLTTARLYEVLDELVELAWIESGMPFRHGAVELGAVIERALADLSPVAEAKHITFAVAIQQPMPRVMGDEVRLAHALKQLLNNALQFSDPETLIAVHGWGDTHTALVSIADQGFGIAPDEIDQIFDRFYRSKDVRVQALPGAGLGLTTARRILQRHGGALDVHSIVDKGTTFTLSLPSVES
jgi:signal transduction histidine kinase